MRFEGATPGTKPPARPALPPLVVKGVEALLPQVKDMAHRHGDFPVIVAGGIFTHEDIASILRQGADEVQDAGLTLRKAATVAIGAAVPRDPRCPAPVAVQLVFGGEAPGTHSGPRAAARLATRPVRSQPSQSATSS